MQVNSVDRSPNWRPAGADLYSTGASRPAPVRQQNLANPTTAANAPEPQLSATDAAQAKNREVDTHAPRVTEPTNYDWTIKKPPVEKQEIPPPKPLYMKLIEHLQAMWRASGNAVEVVDEVNKTVNPAKLVQNPLVYPDPKLRKVSGNN